MTAFTQLNGVSVLVPIFNEQQALITTLISLEAMLKNQGQPFEIIAIDDGSTDQSHVMLDELNLPSLVVLKHATNRGYGASLTTGLKYARYDAVVITDADGTYPIERIPDLLDGLSTSAMVIGARTGSNVSIPVVRRLAKWGLRQLAQWLTGATIADLNSGLRAMQRDVLLPLIPLLPQRFSWTSTVTVALHLLQHPVVYIPINYHHRTGVSKFHPIIDTGRSVHCIVRAARYVRRRQLALHTQEQIYLESHL